MRRAVVVCLMLARCAQPPPAPVALAVRAGPVAVDGAYQGYLFQTGSRGEDMICASRDPIRIQVADRSFTYVLNEPQLPYDLSKTFVVSIAADGRFQSIVGSASVSGRADGRGLTGDVVGGACYYHFDVVRP